MSDPIRSAVQQLRRFPGIGEKTATKLIAEHGSLNAVLESQALPPPLARKIEASRQYLETARTVIPPVESVPLGKASLDLPTTPRHPRILDRLGKEHELSSAIERVRRATAALVTDA